MSAKLYTTDDDIYELSQLAFNARDTSKHVKVPLDALKHMVMDHATLLHMARPELEPLILVRTEPKKPN